MQPYGALSFLPLSEFMTLFFTNDQTNFHSIVLMGDLLDCSFTYASFLTKKALLFALSRRRSTKVGGCI